MKQSVLLERYPIYSLEIDRGETSLASVDDICAYLRGRIDAHKSAVLVFCFGIALPDPQVLALRPRSIGVAETERGFVVTFMEAPMPVANAAMEDWAKGLRDRHIQPA